jgi:hypothetical protein
MAFPPANPRAIVFIDGQNLFHAVKSAFGYSFPNYDVCALAERLCGDKGREKGTQLVYLPVSTSAAARRNKPGASWSLRPVPVSTSRERASRLLLAGRRSCPRLASRELT